MKLNFKKTKIKTLQNDKAAYGFIELKNFIDFEVKRVYYIYNCKQATGQHCHKEEKEFFVMQTGACTAIIDSGAGKEDVRLETGDAIYVGAYVWHGFKDFTDDAFVLAMSSTNYGEDRSDYIEDYFVYKRMVE
ncbi:MAG: FdtA/QdtA family cupin domain-containing protein [Patescibacteria group bacterium]